MDPRHSPTSEWDQKCHPVFQIKRQTGNVSGYLAVKAGPGTNPCYPLVLLTEQLQQSYLWLLQIESGLPWQEGGGVKLLFHSQE